MLFVRLLILSCFFSRLCTDKNSVWLVNKLLEYASLALFGSYIGKTKDSSVTARVRTTTIKEIRESFPTKAKIKAQQSIKFPL